jgi:hypothetical protein
MHSGTVRRNSWRILGCKLGEFWHSLGKVLEVCGRIFAENLPLRVFPPFFVFKTKRREENRIVSYVNRALFGISTSADPCCSLQRLPRRTSVSHDRARTACNARKAAIGPQRSIFRIKHDLHRRNAQSAHSPAKPASGSRAQRLPRRAHVPMTGRAGHTRLPVGTTPSVGGGRCPDFGGVARVRMMPSEQEESARDSSESLWQRARIII